MGGDYPRNTTWFHDAPLAPTRPWRRLTPDRTGKVCCVLDQGRVKDFLTSSNVYCGFSQIRKYKWKLCRHRTLALSKLKGVSPYFNDVHMKPTHHPAPSANIAFPLPLSHADAHHHTYTGGLYMCHTFHWFVIKNMAIFDKQQKVCDASVGSSSIQHPLYLYNQGAFNWGDPCMHTNKNVYSSKILWRIMYKHAHLSIWRKALDRRTILDLRPLYQAWLRMMMILSVTLFNLLLMANVLVFLGKPRMCHT